MKDHASFVHRVCTSVKTKYAPHNPNKLIQDNHFNAFKLKKNDYDLMTSSDILPIDSYLEKALQGLKLNYARLPKLFDKNKEKRLLNKWFSDNAIVVRQTDKNLGIAIISIHDYHLKTLSLLADRTTYLETHFNRDVIVQSYLYVLDFILIESSKLVRISNKEKSYLLEPTILDTFTLPIFYIIPKIHKNPWVGRPIVSSCNWITRNMAIWLNVFLEKFAKTLPTTIKDSKELIQLLDGIVIKPNSNFFSLDAVSMYTKLPLNKVFTAMRKRPLDFPNYIISALEFCCSNNYFSYIDKTYLQLDGLPMGINFAVAFANIAVFLLVESSELLIPFQPFITFWGRYIDDCNGIWTGPRNVFDLFFETMNQIEPSIQWTLGEYGKHVIYLDLVASITPNNQIQFELYQKKLNKYLYLPYHSTHTLATKRGWIKGELIRLCRNNSSRKRFRECVMLLFTRLVKRNYPEDFVTTIFQEFDYSIRDSLLLIDVQNEANTFHITQCENQSQNFFRKQRKIYIDTAIINFGSKGIPNADPKLVFVTDYCSSTRLLGLKKLYNPVPAFTTHKSFNETEVIIAYRIQNKLSSIFTHKKTNQKIRNYLIENQT